MKMFLYSTFFSGTEHDYPKTSTSSESVLKIKFVLRETLFEILLISTVTYKQRLLHENEIVQFI